MRLVRRVWDLGFVKDFGGCAGADAAKTHVPGRPRGRTLGWAFYLPLGRNVPKGILPWKAGRKS